MTAPQTPVELASVDGLARIREHLVPQALDQLAAVTETTERAANDIMNACDQLLLLMQQNGQPAPAPSPVGPYLTEIFEACAFQDLTGQRIAQVRKILKLIDYELGQPALALRPTTDAAAIAATAPGKVNGTPLGGPLAGPQRAEDAIHQSDVDWLFSLLV
jgi:chemotaxis protein CheZ